MGAWKTSVAPSKPVFSFPKGPSGREDVESELEPWPVLGIGEPWSERRVEGGALPFELMLGRSDAYADRLKAREAEENRKIFPGSYNVVAALDYLRRQTPAAIFKLAADRWRAHGRARRLVRARNLLGADVAGYMAEEWDDDERDEDEGPAMLGDEARAAADAVMRPRAPAWEFLPLRVTVAKANVVTGMKPGDRPELDVKLTLVRRRQPGATKFGSGTPTGGSKKSSARTRDEANAARRGPGAYRLRYGQTERRAPRAVMGTSGLGDDAIMEDDEDAYAEGSVLDIDPAAAFAAAVARRKGTAVDMSRMPHPRVDDAERARRREELDLAELTDRPEVETTPLKAFRAPDGRGGWSALMDVSPAASRRRRLAEERRAKMEGISEGISGPDSSSPTKTRMRAKDKLTDPSSDAYVRRRTDAGVMDFASMTFRVSERTPGNVELDLLEAGIGPGTYAAEPVSRRVPEVDFARGAARFALTDAEKAPPDEPLEGERVAIEPGPAFDATRPDATRGGVISPLPTRRSRPKEKTMLEKTKLVKMAPPSRRTPTRCTTWNGACGTCVRRGTTSRRRSNAGARVSPIRRFRIRVQTRRRLTFTPAIWTRGVGRRRRASRRVTGLGVGWGVGKWRPRPRSSRRGTYCTSTRRGRTTIADGGQLETFRISARGARERLTQARKSLPGTWTTSGTTPCGLRTLRW